MIENNTPLSNWERTIISTLLLQPEYLGNIQKFIFPKDFKTSKYQAVYIAIQELSKRNIIPDVPMITDFLAHRKVLESLGGVLFIQQLKNEAESVSEEQFNAYTKKLLSNINREKTKKELKEALSELENPEIQLQQFVNSLFEKIDFVNAESPETFETISKSAEEVFKEIELKESGALPEFAGISTGYPTLDKITKGLKGGEVTIIAARPGVGKTAFALNLATNAALITKKPILYYSLEMSNKMISKRVISIISGIPQEAIQTAKLDEKEKALLLATKKIIEHVNIELKNTGVITSQSISSEVKKYHKKTPVGAVVIDYLQLISSDNKENRTQQISEISRNLKLLATELDIPVIALSQMSRSSEQRQNKRPLLSDLRESGAIEQDASLIAFIQQEEALDFENDEALDEECESISQSFPTLTTLIVAKNRSGELKDIKFNFHKNIQRFKEITEGVNPSLINQNENNQLLNYATAIDELEIISNNNHSQKTQIVPHQESGILYAVETLTDDGKKQLLENVKKYIYNRDHIPIKYLTVNDEQINEDAIISLNNILSSKHGLFLYGNTDKALSYALDYMNSQMTTEPSILDEIKYINYLNFKDSINFENRGQVMQGLIFRKLLIIDNFGLDQMSNRFSKEVLISLLKTRQDNQLSTFIISPHNLSEIESGLFADEHDSKTAEYITDLIRNYEVQKI